jgi:hypothetical protein
MKNEIGKQIKEMRKRIDAIAEKMSKYSLKAY